MPSTSAMSCAGRAGLAALLIGCAGWAYAGEPASTPQSTVSLDFLSRLESGRVEDAYALLDPTLREKYPIQQLYGAAKSLGGVRFDRRISYQGSGITARGKMMVQRQVQQRIGASSNGSISSYLVCIINTPRSGYGSVIYAAAFLRMNAASQAWRITDYRIDAEPHPSCVR